MKNTFQDCYAEFNGISLTIGNAKMQRVFELVNSYPVSTEISNKETGYIWSKKSAVSPNKSQLAAFNLPFFNFYKCSIDVSTNINDNEGLSDRFLQCTVLFSQSGIRIKWELNIFPKLPFISTRLYVKGKPAGADNVKSIYTMVNVPSVSDGVETYPDQDNDNMLALPEEDTIDAFSIFDKHIKVSEIQFFDRTDDTNTLVKKHEDLPYFSRKNKYSGNMFYVNSYLKDESLLIIKDGLTHTTALNRYKEELFIRPLSSVEITGSGMEKMEFSNDEFVPCYGCTIGVGSVENLKHNYMKFYNAVCLGDKSESLFIMSNTWGDRNQDKSVCEEFILNEISLAAKLGVDIVQIDDGWQNGATANSACVKGGVWEGYYEFDADFWSVNSSKFPNGLKKLTKYAAEMNIKLALWFSPDSSSDFINWHKDANILLSLYKEHGISYFKLDGIKIRNKQCEINMKKLLETISRESNNAVSFNMDITAETRFGYFYEKQFGTIFVENRYTDWGNYYPHLTLKNIWTLAEYLPLRKFQFEVLNNKRNISNYQNDPLAPAKYSIDYLFATTIFANPLIWAEMSNLEKRDVECIANFAKVYKNERKRIFSSIIKPIGQMPDGTSFTGFQAIFNENEGYLLLFREFSKFTCFEYEIETGKICNEEASFGSNKCEVIFECLYSNIGPGKIFVNSSSINSKAPILIKNNHINISINEQAAFAFLKYHIS